MSKPRNAAELIRACIDNPLLGARCFENFYVMAYLELGDLDPQTIEHFEKGKSPSLALKLVSKSGIYGPGDRYGVKVTSDCPIIVEDKARALASWVLDKNALTISKQEARIYKGLRGPFTLTSDNVVVVNREGEEEPLILLVVRDADAPSPNTECCPGGWVGPGDVDQAAQIKLDREIKFVLPSLGAMTFTQLKAFGLAEDFGMEMRTFPINVTACGGQASGEVECWPFFHLAAKPDFADDANMLDLLRIVRVTLPRGSTIEDATPFNRQIELVPLSRFAEDRGRPTLPTVDFVRDTLLPRLIAS